METKFAFRVVPRGLRTHLFIKGDQINSQSVIKNAIQSKQKYHHPVPQRFNPELVPPASTGLPRTSLIDSHMPHL
jgi:hypothetical protein